MVKKQDEDDRSRSSTSTEIIDPHNVEKWGNNENVIRKQWLEQLQYVLIIVQDGLSFIRRNILTGVCWLSRFVMS